MRPVVLNYDQDPRVRDLNDEYMVGDDILVAPVVQKSQFKRLVYLPAGNWVDFWNGAEYAGNQDIVVDTPLDKLPLFVKQNTILPWGPAVSLPIMRPVVLNYDQDPRVRDLNDEYMVGDDILVAPVVQKSQFKRLVYLPAGNWVDFVTDAHYAANQNIEVDARRLILPIFVKQNTILPWGPAVSLPIMRPVVLNYDQDPRVRQSIVQILLCGRTTLCSSVWKSHFKRLVYLPAGNWVDFWNGAVYAGNQ
ncbi:hypothetical protein WP50_20850, partial [Lactiplantibacillus plantarum]